MRKLIQNIVPWFESGNRWWLPLCLGILYSLCFAPFNHEANLLLAPFPLLGFGILVPFFAFSIIKPIRRSMLYTYLFGIGASFAQYYWISNVVAEGIYHLILIGLVAAVLYLACYFLLAGLWFRALKRAFPRFYLILFPAAWILIEFIRGNGEVGFPWNFMGYITVPMLPIAQFASVAGIYGLSFLVVFANVVLWELARSYQWNDQIKQKWLHVLVVFALFAGLAIWGAVRMERMPSGNAKVKVSLVQPNIDQAHWGHGSLDTSIEIIESLTLETAEEKPDLIVLPESALFCYLARRSHIARRVANWVDTTRIPILLGALHWDRNEGGGAEYSVYNCAFVVDSTAGEQRPTRWPRYGKVRLLPFSETMPFKAQLPILNRLNLGSSDFSAGDRETIFNLGDRIRAGPFICFEILFPDFVRKRIKAGANLIVNITNDGWFGKSTGPYHHAAMARMRCIENGVSMVRCANSGITMFVDQYGRVHGRTDLYTRTVLVDDVSLSVIPTLYTLVGDWPLVASGLALVAGLVGWYVGRVKRKKKQS